MIFGRSDQHANLQFKKATRWGSNPAVYMLNDYDKLLSLLFAKSAERDRKYRERKAAEQVQKINIAFPPIINNL